MKYFSEILNKTFDTENDCVAAEAAYEIELEERKTAEAKKRNERKERAAEVEAARKTMVEAQNAYRDKLQSFVKDYGSYHYSTENVKDIPHLFFDLFNL